MVPPSLLPAPPSSQRLGNADDMTPSNSLQGQEGREGVEGEPELLVIASLRHFPWMLFAGYTRCCRVRVLHSKAPGPMHSSPPTYSPPARQGEHHINHPPWASCLGHLHWQTFLQIVLSAVIPPGQETQVPRAWPPFWAGVVPGLALGSLGPCH